MPAHKVLFFIGMLIFEIWAWGFVGNRLAPIFSSENNQYEVNADCPCEHEISYRIKHANISDAKKTEYLTKFATM